jgi:hypothetical protein
MTKTAYQEATGAEETCMMCPHRICPKRDADSYECPARVREKLLEKVIETALTHLNNHAADIFFVEKAINLLKEAKEAMKIK